MTRAFLITLCGLGVVAGLPAYAESAPPAAPPSLEIPDVVVEGSDPVPQTLPSIAPGEPELETQFQAPPAGPSATERDLRQLQFRTAPNLFEPLPLGFKDGATSLTGSFGRPDWFRFSGRDSRQIGPFHSFVQAEGGSATGTVGAQWWQGQTRLALGYEQNGWRFNLAGDGSLRSTNGATLASQMWGNGRLSVVQPLGADSLTYRAGWESGGVRSADASGTPALTTATEVHGGDVGLRWEPTWGDHHPRLDASGGFHWAGLSAWPVGSVQAADRIQTGAAEWDFGLKYDLVGQDHSVAPMARVSWRGWPEMVVSAVLDGGQQTPFASQVMRARPFAQFGTDLRSEVMLAQAGLRLERRLAKGLVFGLGASAGGIDRKLFWSRVGESPFWQLRNAPGPMLQWGGDAGLRYDLGGVIPFVTYKFQQASTPVPNAAYPTDGSHDLRLGFEMAFTRFRLETAARLMVWNLSPVASGRDQGAQTNALLLDGALAYDITDTVQAHLRVSDGLVRSSDMLPGYWEPAFAVMGGVGVQF
jgi:hypothetical protein